MANYNLTQTGAQVQALLDTVAAGYIYMGVADLTTTPDTTNPNVCYLLKAVGTYTNFGNIQHASGIGIALWDGSAWSYQNVPSSAVVETDATPTENSANPVQSGGVYDAMQDVKGKVAIPIKYTNGYIKTSDPVGTTIDLNVHVNLSPWMCYVSECREGDIIYVSGTGGLSPRLWAFLDSDYKIISQSAANTTANNLPIVAPTNAAWVIVNDNSGKTSYIQIPSSITENALKLREQDSQDGVSIITEADLTLFEDNNYITNRGIVKASTSYKILSYSAQKGDYIYVRSVNTSLTSTIASGTGTNKNSLVVGGVSDNEYRYMVGEDGTIYITINKVSTAGYEISIIRNNQYKSLLEQNETPYNSIEGLLTKQRGYILFSDGSLGESGSPLYVYKFASAGIKKVKVYVTGEDNNTAAIAFYSTDTISTASYISGVQMNGNLGGGRWYESDVPSNAVLIAVTNHASYCPNPLILVNNLSQEVLGTEGIDSAISAISNFSKANAFAGGNPFRFGGPLWAHLFTDKIYEHSTDIVIPSESLLDIRISRRLGFDVIEANIHETSDHKFVVIHGASGTFGYEVTDLNGDFTYANTAINSVTLDWINENIRYRSDIVRFRTQIPTLEEFLSECRLQGMIPLAQASTRAMVAILDKYMGVGNYIAYNGTRALTFAPITTYASLTTKEAILERARSYGVPYIYSLANYNDFTDEELSEIVDALHSEGYMIASAYVSGASATRLRRLGFDMIASTIQVNDFDNANLCILSSGVDWSDFTINGATPTTNGIPLSNGQSVSPATTPETVFLGKAQLQVTFTGKLGAICGKDYAEITSDGTHPLVLSSYFINSAPTFVIYGFAEGATITDIVFKASKC